MIERVVGEQTFCLCGFDQRVIATDKRRRHAMSDHDLIVAQSHCQLHGIVGFEGMSASQECSRKEIIALRAHQFITPSYVIHELVECAFPRNAPDTTDAKQHGKSCCDFGNADIGNKDRVSWPII